MNLLMKLSKQLQYGLRSHVGLRQHCRGSLLENVVLGKSHDLFRHVEVTNPGLSSLQVLSRSAEVSNGVLETVLVSTKLRAFSRNFFYSFLDGCNCCTG